jgi:hypothetical protein
LLVSLLLTLLSMRRHLSLIPLLAVLACVPKVDETFDDHTLLQVKTLADFEKISATASGRTTGKFIITSFGTDTQTIRYVDTHFFALHDEWYWFRLMNNQRIPGREGIAPVPGHTFKNIAEIYTWARTQTVLPLDLQWVEGDRLYSPRFYDLALFLPPRAFGLGTLIHVSPSATRPERWGFMLEFVDTPSHAELTHFFKALESTLPADIAPQVKWIVRSTPQEALAKQIEAQKLPFYDRILRVTELSVKGETEVYNEGLTAGRLKRIAAGESTSSTTANDILILEEVPDFLPPAAGVVTAVPQTPLAHFNLLAKNRGIPNVYRGGAMEEQELIDWAYQRIPVVIKSSGTGDLIIKPLSEGQFSQWQQSQKKSPVSVQQVDVSTLPYTHNLRMLSAADSDTLRPSIGGKATGYLGLIAGAPTATPDSVGAITIRPDVEHVAPFRSRIESMLSAPGFSTDVRVRALALEGILRYAVRFPGASDLTFRDTFLISHPTGDVLGDFARQGGLKQALRDAPMNAANLMKISDALRAQFGHYAPTQGLRFRSSSTAEDVEGFNGAGLYDSNTGFIDTSVQPATEQKQSIEWAIKKTWASYWGVEAYEERALESIDHLSGNMAIVVHARFDDASEKTNGVFLFTIKNGEGILDLNVQAGAVSVTNPTTTSLPEVDRVTLKIGATTPTIERLRQSTLAPAGTLLLTDAELLETFARAKEVATKWLAQSNSTRPPEQHARTQVLDFEFRQVPAGWPALKVGTLPARIVLKQTRTIEPGLRGLPMEVAALPIPKDILTRSRRVERRTCESSKVTAVVIEALTDKLANPDVGYSVVPFTASVKLTFKQAIPELNVMPIDVIDVNHINITSTAHPEANLGWQLTTNFSASAQVNQIQLKEGLIKLTSQSGMFSANDVRCTVEVLRSTSVELLLSFL